MKLTITILSLLIALSVAQSQDTRKINFGTEQDILPYLTGGYYAAVWAGHNHFRVRALTANVKKPDLMVPDGFSNNWVTAYAFLGEYFLKNDWRGWSVSSGFVYWQNSIELTAGSEKAKYDTYLLNGSIGYTFTLYRHFYITPWAGLHMKVGGPKTITIDEQSFDQSFLNPEASIKLGIYF